MRGRALRVMALGTILLCLLLNPVYAQEKVKVTLWSIGDENGTYAAVFNKLTPKIEEQLPHIDIEVEYNSNEEKFTVALAGGVAPDIIILATRSAGKFVEAGLLAPIDREVFGVETDEELRGLFYGGAIGSMWMSDDVYFMPTEVTTLGTFVNLDLLAEAGLEPAVPKTWEGLLAYAKRAMRKDAEGNVQIAGLHLNRHYIWPSLYWVAMVRQAGTDWIVDGQPQFSHPGAVDHIEFYQSLHSVEGVTKPGISNADFYRGEAAIYVGGQYELAHMFNPERVQYSWTTGGFPHFEGKPRVSTSYAWGHVRADGLEGAARGLASDRGLDESGTRPGLVRDVVVPHSQGRRLDHRSPGRRSAPPGLHRGTGLRSHGDRPPRGRPDHQRDPRRGTAACEREPAVPIRARGVGPGDLDHHLGQLASQPSDPNRSDTHVSSAAGGGKRESAACGLLCRYL